MPRVHVVKMMGNTSLATVNRRYLNLDDETGEEVLRSLPCCAMCDAPVCRPGGGITFGRSKVKDAIGKFTEGDDISEL